MEKSFYISGLGDVIYIYFIQWSIYGEEKGAPVFKEFEASSLSCPVIGPAFGPGLDMKAR